LTHYYLCLAALSSARRQALRARKSAGLWIFRRLIDCTSLFVSRISVAWLKYHATEQAVKEKPSPRSISPSKA